MDFFQNFREGSVKKGFTVDSTQLFEKSLTGTLSKIQETIYSEAVSQNAFPMAEILGPGLTAIEYYKGEPTGEMSLIGASAQDLPFMDESMDRTERPVGNYGGTFGWSFIEFERYQRQNYNVNGRRARNARKISERTVDKVLLSEGDSQKTNILGVFGYQMSAVSGLTGNWSAATDQQILDDLQRICEASYTGGGGEYEPDRVMLGTSNFGVLRYRIDTETRRSLLVIAEEQLGVQIIRSSRLNSVTSATNSLSAAPAAIAYKYDPDLCEYNMPRPFMMRPGEWRGNRYCVDCYLDFAGFFNYLPPQFSVADLS